MWNELIDGIGRRFSRPEDPDHHHRRGRHGHRHGGGHGGRHGGRLFDYGELRLLVLALMEDEARHGYELMKLIEERFGGSYTPSPGVIYPTLAWLDDMGYAAIDAEEGGRKRYRVTPEGRAFLEANRPAVEDLLARGGAVGEETERVPAPVVRAMENLKVALRLRLRREPLDRATAESIAAAIDMAAQTVERS